MHHTRFVISIFIAVFIVTSCSLTDKLKEKLSSDKDKEDTKEETKTEDTKELTSTADLEFYNKYIDVSNKIQEAGDKVYKDYVSDVPEPKTITKSSFILAVSLGLSADNLERVMKEYNRSYFDGGELSRLSASAEMKNEIEGELKNLLRTLETYHRSAIKVADYYRNNEYKSDLSKAVPFDEEIKSEYEKYKSAFGKFSAAIKKYKPKLKQRDPNSVSNPDERSVIVLMNSYESTLDAAEEFYSAFNGLEYKADLSKAKEQFIAFENVLKSEKNNVFSAEFTDKTKYMKYSYEDYFMKMAERFVDAANKFFNTAPDAKNVNDFNRAYDDVVNNYNYMITAYNTNINIVNSFRVY